MFKRIGSISSIFIVLLLILAVISSAGHLPVIADDGEPEKGDITLQPFELPDKGNPKLDSVLNELVPEETSSPDPVPATENATEQMLHCDYIEGL